jgi:hypothetical protein
MKVTYTTSDGQTFEGEIESEVKALAKAHERELKARARALRGGARRKNPMEAFVNLLMAEMSDLTPEQIDTLVVVIRENPSAVKPLLRKPRADAGVKRGPRGRQLSAVAAA